MRSLSIALVIVAAIVACVVSPEFMKLVRDAGPMVAMIILVALYVGFR